MDYPLGRVIKPVSEERGPDALYELSLPSEWLEQGASIEFELPRHLTCAACRGGGCDACGRSGAVTVRSRNEPPELVPVTLPRHAVPDGASGIVLRIPECGGPAPELCGRPRGLLLLKVLPGTERTASVRRVDSAGPANRRPWQGTWLRQVALALLVAIGLVVAWLLGGL